MNLRSNFHAWAVALVFLTGACGDDDSTEKADAGSSKAGTNSAGKDAAGKGGTSAAGTNAAGKDAAGKDAAGTSAAGKSGAGGTGGSAAGKGGSSAGAGGAAGKSGSGGSGGSGGAAVNCATYCGLAIGKMCTGSLEVYADMAACMTGCGMITTPGSASDTAGNTLGCRIYHLTVANMNATNAMTHCPHGKVMSDVCK